MGKYWRCGLAAAAVTLGAHAVWAQNVVGCPAGQVMQSSDPSGKSIICVAIPDTAALQQQIGDEATARQNADKALGDRIDALTEADIVGKWAVSGTTNCLQSSTGFDANMNPVIPVAPSNAFVSQLSATFIGTRTFNAGGTGRTAGTSHALTFPGTFHRIQPNDPNPPVFVAGVGATPSVAGVAVATADEADFKWYIELEGTLRIEDDDSIVPQRFTAPKSREGWTVTIENLPPFVGHIGKDRRTIVMTHPSMDLETSITRDDTGAIRGRTPRFCTRYRVLTRLD